MVDAIAGLSNIKKQLLGKIAFIAKARFSI